MSSDTDGFWSAEGFAPELSAMEKDLRDKFVTEYLLDYDQTAAAIRIGFASSFASTYAEKFMQEPYVRKAIATRQIAEDDEKLQAEFDRRMIRASLLREAHYRGPGSSHAARVAALGKLASIRDMDAPTKIKHDLTSRGGVMLVPNMAEAKDWEKEAIASQSELQKDTTL